MSSSSTNINTSTSSDKEKNIYKYRISGKYVLGKDTYNIDYENVHSMVIDYQYVKLNMPMIFAIFNLSSKITDVIIKNKDKGIFILNIEKCIENVEEPEWETYIENEFVYFINEDINKSDAIDYQGEDNEDRTDIIMQISVGLLSKELVNHNKNPINGVISGDNMSSVIAYVIGGNDKAIIETPDNNSPVKNFYIPPLNSTSKAIKYLDDHRVFFTTPYRFFMDFDVRYLLSYKGKPVERKDEQYSTIMINIINNADPYAYSQGLLTNTENKFYEMSISGEEVEVSDNEENSKVRTTYKYNDTNAKQTKIDAITPSNESNFEKKILNLRAPNDNGGLIENNEKLRDNDIYIAINKTDIDISIFTPNKEYIIDADGVYGENNKYNGNWILVRKRELFFKSTGASDDKITAYMLLILRKAIE